MRQKEKARIELRYQVMGRFKAEGRQRDGYFDCGELGILHLYWRRDQSWGFDWIEEIEPLPEGIDINKVL